MEVKIKTDFWKVQTFTVNIEPEALVFQSERDIIRIPFGELTRLYITGPSDEPNRFTIETGGKEYEGRFQGPGDGNTLLELLRESVGKKIEINITQNEEERT